MKLLATLIILVFFQSCSFDNKTGIWNSGENISKKEANIFNEFKTLSNYKDDFNSIIIPKKNYILEVPKKVNNKKWEDIYYNQFNNFDNFSYEESKNLIFKSKKISKHKLKNFFLYDKGNVALTDIKGNLTIFSI